MVQDNVSHVYTTISEFVPQGIRTEDGQVHEFDLIICATGFNVAFVPTIQVFGRDGLSIQEAWKDEPKHVTGLSILQSVLTKTL